MRAWIISDIHFYPMQRHWGRCLRIPEADVCICAGDVCDHILDSISFLRREIEPRMPVILVLGNHDYFGSSIDHALEQARSLTEGTRIRLLENETMTIGDVRIIGATLWTDYAVSVGLDESVPAWRRQRKAFGLVPYLLLDYQKIYRSDERRPGETGLVTIQEILARHNDSRRYIANELSKPIEGRTVILTHHAPLMQSMDPDFYGEASGAAFASDLSSLIEERKPHLWIHGHIHKFRDYMFGGTRIICNPQGWEAQRETGGFQTDFVIDL
ncbi:Icc-related predicted phosphoesterase [Rhizobium sp. BK313]|uniref:metallophosphoesterase n=1 Tax=Rhizobium sp. BK313 TaxID=2587081 RepID=UPI00105B739C|nr:metallophosphoesterase [Rhizobium sp. BK313]MBB3452809.1 Icc-related predicted phosphoesterase [Rhizobium sp. BK313]